MANVFENDRARLSYGMGMNMGEYLTHVPFEVDLVAALAGISDMVRGCPKMEPAQYRATMQEIQSLMQKAGAEQSARIAQANQAAEQEFLTRNRTQSGVIETPSGLQYQVLKEGQGNPPGTADTVKVHYTGKLLDGTVFDSSEQRGEPVEFGVTQVIPGWTEALQLMKPGARFRLFIPARLAYGERGAGGAIPPNAALIFEVELLEVRK